jgi:hypothetical protein
MPRARRDKIDPTNEHVLLKLTVVDPRRDVYFAAKRADRQNNLFARLPLFLLKRWTVFFSISLLRFALLKRLLALGLFSLILPRRAQLHSSVHF